jgi:hypothetical protein
MFQEEIIHLSVSKSSLKFEYTHSTVAVDSQVWLYGGEADASRRFDDLWVFNTTSRQWSEAPRLISAPQKGKSRHSMVRVSAPPLVHPTGKSRHSIGFVCVFILCTPRTYSLGGRDRTQYAALDATYVYEYTHAHTDWLKHSCNWRNTSGPSSFRALHCA